MSLVSRQNKDLLEFAQPAKITYPHGADVLSAKGDKRIVREGFPHPLFRALDFLRARAVGIVLILARQSREGRYPLSASHKAPEYRSCPPFPVRPASPAPPLLSAPRFLFPLALSSSIHGRISAYHFIMAPGKIPGIPAQD